MTPKRVFIGGWADPNTAAILRALARLRGQSQSEVLRVLVNAAGERAAVAVEDDPGDFAGGGTHNRADIILADSGAVVG